MGWKSYSFGGVCKHKLIEIYVSSGSLAGEGTGSYDNPIASVDEAMGFIEDLNYSGKYAEEYRINLLPGTYTEGIKLEGFNNDKVVITGEEAVISGGTKIASVEFEKVTDEDVLSKIPEDARDYIYRVNLCNNGYLSSFDEVFRLFTKENICKIARYPNDDGIESSADYMRTGEITESGFKYTDSRAERWSKSSDMYVYGMFEYDYFDDDYKASVDTERGVINTENGESTILSDRPFYVYNLIEELDTEDEYYYDKQTGYLYVYSEDITSEEYEISCEDDFTVELLNCENVTVSDLTICNSYSNLINIRNGKNNVVKNCELKNGVLRAVYIAGCENALIDSCNMHNLGGGGIYFSSGNRTTLSGGGNVVKNSVIHDYQQINRGYTGAINMLGVNHIASNNLIYNGYSMGINMYGNNLLIENNEIRDVCLETNDMGAIYSHGDWTFRGNSINHNYIHSLKSFHLGVNAIYLDHGVSGTSITNNIFENVAKTGVYVNGGRNNTVENNLFIKNGMDSCSYGIMVTDGLNRGGTYENQNEPPQDLVDKLNEVNYKSEYYSVYDNMHDILEDSPVMPKYNKFINNLFVGIDESVTKNWFYTITYEQFINEFGGVVNNYVSETDPGFYDMLNKDYKLNEDAEIYTEIPSFKEVTLNNIGPR